MRVAVVGASTAAGAAIVEALRFDPAKRVDGVIGLARQLPADPQPHVEWHAVDPTTADLATHLRGVDAIVNASRARSTAPAHGRDTDAVALARSVLGTAVAAGVHHLVQLSTFLCYSPAAGRAIDESWPTGGLVPSAAARRAAALERFLDDFGSMHEVARLVRIRPGFVLGPRVRTQMLGRTGLLGGLLRALEHAPVFPSVRGGVPVVHHDDLAAAVRSSVTEPAFGAYNVALDEPLRPADVASALGAHPLSVPDQLVRSGAAFADRALQRIPRGGLSSASTWVEVLGEALTLDTARARSGLGWVPRHGVEDALRATISGA